MLQNYSRKLIKEKKMIGLCCCRTWCQQHYSNCQTPRDFIYFCYQSTEGGLYALIFLSFNIYSFFFLIFLSINSDWSNVYSTVYNWQIFEHLFVYFFPERKNFPTMNFESMYSFVILIFYNIDNECIQKWWYN